MIRIDVAGKGTYGIVYNAKMSKKDDEEVAVKRNIVDTDLSFSGCLRELDLLNRLRGHPYIVKLHSISFGNPFIAPNSPIADNKKGTLREDYMHFIFEKADKNIHQLIYEKEIHVGYFKLAMVQILLGVEYMHAKGVIHRDIKPSNLLWFLSEDGQPSVKLCDFGLSKIKSFQEPSSPGVVTCWYRAPEICGRDEKYSFSSDIWSVGCVFYEMVSGRALLKNCRDEDIHLLENLMRQIPYKQEDIDYLSGLLKGLGGKKPAKLKGHTNWREIIGLKEGAIAEFNKYPSDESDHWDRFLDLLEKMLQCKPEKRPSATEALAHPFFEPYKDVIDWARENYPPVPKGETKTKIKECKERKWSSKLAFVVFNNRANLEWYSHRILFHSIDLFDAYLEWYEEECKKRGTLKLESAYSGRLLSRFDTHLRYLVCLYMSIKYFTTLGAPVSFGDLATDEYRTPKCMTEAEEFEQKMVRDVLRFKVYRDTVYEALDKLEEGKVSETKIRDLLLNYGNSPSKEGTPFELLQSYLTISKS